MKSEDAKEGMLVEVRFSAVIGGFEGDDKVLVKRTDSKSERFWDHSIPAALCTPILPDFGEGDLVEHVPTGARGRVRPFVDGGILNHQADKVELCIRIPRSRSPREDLFVNWLAAECRIVRKAGETE